MIQYVSLLTDSVIRTPGNSTIIIQTQDPWVANASQILSVFIGGLIALIANYLLQMRSFSIQNETSQKNQRIAAYGDLIGHISNYESALGSQGTRFIEDMGLYLARAVVYGSPEISALIIPEIKKLGIENNREFLTSIEKIKAAIIKEITMDENQEQKNGWHFW
jgi:hypothetical protein